VLRGFQEHKPGPNFLGGASRYRWRGNDWPRERKDGSNRNALLSEGRIQIVDFSTAARGDNSGNRIASGVASDPWLDLALGEKVFRERRGRFAVRSANGRRRDKYVCVDIVRSYRRKRLVTAQTV
jgi:hypothetical protein